MIFFSFSINEQREKSFLLISHDSLLITKNVSQQRGKERSSEEFTRAADNDFRAASSLFTGRETLPPRARENESRKETVKKWNSIQRYEPRARFYPLPFLSTTRVEVPFLPSFLAARNGILESRTTLSLERETNSFQIAILIAFHGDYRTYRRCNFRVN